MLWVLCAKRPLTMEELQHAIALDACKRILTMEELQLVVAKDIRKRGWLSESLPERELLLSICGGLVTFEAQSGYVRLLHETTQAWLEERKSVFFPDADVLAAQTCLAYLSNDAFNIGMCTTDEQVLERREQYPLLNYAAYYWGAHYKDHAEASLETCALHFLEKDRNVSCSADILESRLYGWVSPPRYEFNLLSEHICARFGLKKLLAKVQKPSYERIDWKGRTPLHHAAESGHGELVEFLLDQGVNRLAVDNDGATPFERAVANGHENVIRRLIHHDSAQGCRDDVIRLGLNAAARMGLLDVLRSLLTELNVDSLEPQHRYNKGNRRTPLAHAVERGRRDTVNLLLEYNAAVNAPLEGGPENIRAPLFYAADAGHAEIAEMLLDRGAEVNSIETTEGVRTGRTALSFAAQYGHESVVELLLVNGADVDLTTPEHLYDNMTPLHYAASRGHTAIVSLLAKNNADVNILGNDVYENEGMTPLAFAAKRGHESTFRTLIQHGARMDGNTADEGSSSRTILSYASESGNPAMVQLLLDFSAVAVASPINRSDDDGRTPLSYAAAVGCRETLRLLLDCGADVNSQDTKGITPLMFAARGKFAQGRSGATAGIVECATLLIDRGAHIDAVDQDGRTTLLYAAREGNERLVKLLLAHGVQKNSGAAFPRRAIVRSALCSAAKRGHENVVRVLIRQGVRQGIRVDSRKEILCLAVEHPKVIDLLLSHGSPHVNATYQGRTPLSHAAEHNYEATMLILLSHGAEIDFKEATGKTALWHAIENGNHAASRLLIDRGASLSTEIPDRSNVPKTVLMLATEYSDVAIVKMLLDRGAKVRGCASAAPRLGTRTPLSYAAEVGGVVLAKMFLNRGARVDEAPVTGPYAGRTALSYAAENGHMAMVNCLHNLGSNVDLAASSGRTPLSYAVIDVNCGCLAQLIRMGGNVNSQAMVSESCCAEPSIGNLAVTRWTRPLRRQAQAWSPGDVRATPLHFAAHEGTSAAVMTLLDAGATTDAATIQGFTALHIACKAGKSEVTQLLLERGAAIDARTGKGMVPLHFAAGNEACDERFVNTIRLVFGIKQEDERVPFHMTRTKWPVRMLLERGANPIAKTNKGETPLHFAAMNGRDETVELLLDVEVDLDAVTESGETPLHLSCRTPLESETAAPRYVRVMQLLLKHGANCDARTNEGWTALHLAAFNGRTSGVKFLLGEGAELDALTSEGMTPLHLSCATSANPLGSQIHINDSQSIIELLLQHGANRNAKANRGETPLHFAALLGSSELTRLLIRKGLQVDALADGGKTPLHFLCARNKETIADDRSHIRIAEMERSARLLLRYGANRDAKTDKGETALQIAAYNGWKSIVILLFEWNFKLQRPIPLSFPHCGYPSEWLTPARPEFPSHLEPFDSYYVIDSDYDRFESDSEGSDP